MLEENDYNCLAEGEALRDNYRIKEILSISELSVVYIGYDLKNQRNCIIKEYFPKKVVLRDLDKRTVLCKMPSLKDKYYNSLKMFFNEAIFLKMFNHKNIARYIDHFLENNTGYIVMEYYEGLTLDEYMKEEIEISLPCFFEKIFIHVINAVIEMHKKGILHRDIKPTNIVICQNDVPVIIDFGSAIFYKNRDKRDIFVTPGFSPLEFYSGRTKQGKYSDIYCLAATLYYYLCGIKPDDVPQRVIEDNIEGIKKYNDQITPLFAKVIMKSLSLNYKKRLSSLKLFKMFVYIEYMILKIKDRISEESDFENQ